MAQFMKESGNIFQINIPRGKWGRVNGWSIGRGRWWWWWIQKPHWRTILPIILTIAWIAKVTAVQLRQRKQHIHFYNISIAFIYWLFLF